MIGVLAGVLGTAHEQEAARAQFKQALAAFLETNISEEERPVTFAAPIGAPAEASQGMATAWLIFYLFGWDGPRERLEQASRANQAANDAAAQLVAKALQSLWNSFKKWLDDFWKVYEEEGLFIAINRAHVDLQFFAAELAIDIGIGVLTAGAGAAGLRAIRFVGKRVLRGVTRIEISVPPSPGNPGGKLMDIDVPDAEIDPKAGAIMDEDRFGGVWGPKDTKWADADGNAPTPSTTVIKGQRGQNDIEIDVAPNGRPESVSATLRQDFGGAARGDNATDIGQIGGDGYDGGHLIAHRFMGDTVDGGIAPQVANLNRGAWSKMENEWADWLTKYRPKPGNRVEIDVKIDVDPPGAEVPNGFLVKYKVYEVGPNGSRLEIDDRVKYFENKPGEEFDRVYFRDDGEIK